MNSTPNIIAVFVRIGDGAGSGTSRDLSPCSDLHFLLRMEAGRSQQSSPSPSAAPGPTDGAMGSSPGPVGSCLGTSQSDGSPSICPTSAL